jgi:type I restriction enzyme, R subunit
VHYPDYVRRVTADEGDIGRGHLSRFQDVEAQTPTILTTSQLLTTGVDAPTCKNVVIARVIGSMTDFKQIIGRGTRIRDDYGKLFFNILDYTGSATRLFADPEFDGDPAFVTQEEIDAAGVVTLIQTETADTEEPEEHIFPETPSEIDRRKFYFDGGHVEVACHLVYDLDPDGRQLRVVKFTDYTAENVRTLYPNAAALRREWMQPRQREEIVKRLEERGITFEELAAAAGQPDADPFDLLCHIAFNAPLRTRRERAETVRRERKTFFEQYGFGAREILEQILEKYAEHGAAQFRFPDILKVPPLSERGNVVEIARLFGGSEQLRDAVTQLQTLLYAA